MITNIYFYEGECEKKLIDCLTSERKIKPGRLLKHNFWDEDISSKRRIILRNTTVLVAFDTDVSRNHERFIKNVLTLLRDCNSVVLLAQHENLEGELCFSCGIANSRTLFSRLYSCRSRSDFKKHFIRDRNLYQKLMRSGFDIDKIWSRNDIFGLCLNQLLRPGVLIGRMYCIAKQRPSVAK